MKYQISYILIVLCFSVLIESNTAQAQKKMKYKDVDQRISEIGMDDAYSLLLSFRAYDDEDNNAAYRLAILNKDYSQRFDPITDYDKVQYFLKQERELLQLIGSRIDDKEVRKNKKYYEDISTLKNISKIQLNDVQNDIAKRLQDNEQIKQRLDSTIYHFKSIRKYYNSCLNAYKNIVDTYQTENDMYLTEAKIQAALLLLKSDFEKAVTNFTIYRELLEKHPLKSYNQYWTMMPIKHYGIDGFTDSDFLLEEVKLWDFKKWAEGVEAVLNNKIAPLRKKIIANNEQFNQANIHLPEIDNTLVDELANYDQNPLILRIFKYKIAKAELLTIQSQAPTKNNKTANDANALVSNFARLVISKKHTLQLLEELKNAVNKKALSYYSDFISTYYFGEKGLQSYIVNEAETLERIELDALKDVKEVALLDHRGTTEHLFVNWKSDSLSLSPSVVNFDAESDLKYQTVVIDNDTDGNNYIAGHYKMSSSKTVAFLAKIKNNNVLWLKTFSIRPHIQKRFNDCAVLLKAENGKCHLVINSSTGTGTDKLMFNTLLTTDDTGKEIKRSKLKPNLIPRALYFDPVVNKHIIAFKGTEFDPVYRTDITELQNAEPLTIYGLSDLDTWTTEILMNGCVSDITKVDENYMVLGNYTKYVNLYGETIRSKAAFRNDVNDKSNVMVAILSATGTHMKTGKLETDNSIIGGAAYKVNCTSFYGAIVIGVKEDLTSFSIYKKLQQAPAFYFVTDQFGEIYTSNLK